MDTKQPEALRLAHIFEHPLPPEWSDMVAATKELRRLHTENATLQSGYDAARLEISSLQARVQQLGQLVRNVNSRRVVELEAQLAAVGAGGVEPLRKRECLHQIREPAQAASIEQEAMQMLWNDQQQEEKEHYRNVARGAERIK